MEGLTRMFERRAFWALAILVLVAGYLVLGGSASAQLADGDLGYQDFPYVNSVSHITGEKPQSKLWFNDGSWWGVLFNSSALEYRIYRYDRTSHTWSDTGTPVDARDRSKADVLWDGNKLYVVSATPDSAYAYGSARVLRYSYDPATKSYARDAGFPVTITSGGMEAIVLEKDTTGKLWVTYTQDSKVYVAHSLSDDLTWSSPFVLPVQGASVDPDDISSIIAFGNQIGVMWSNELDGAFYFAIHKDGMPDDAWQVSTPLQGPGMVNDHINLKADSEGRVYAAVKTSLPEIKSDDLNAPYNLLLVRDQDGSWTSHVFGRVRDLHTRPIVLIDEEHRQLYMVASVGQSTQPCCNYGKIYYKRTSLDNPSFEEGQGTPFIQSLTDLHVNDATSTKQNLNSETGLLVEASDDTSLRYLHNFIDLNATDNAAPAIDITTPPDGITYALNQAVDADYSCADEGGSGIVSCEGTVVDGAPIDTSSPGTKQFTVTATDKAGNTSSASRSYTVSDCTVLGTSGDDLLDGTPSDDVICGLGGNDTIRGFEGNDILRGEDGEDTLLGGGGDDALDGGPGGDTASFQSSPTGVDASLQDRAATGEGTDTLVAIENLRGSFFYDKLFGSSEDNLLWGSGTIDRIFGSGGADKIWGGGGSDKIWGGGGDDPVLQGDNGDDSIMGDAGDDSLNSQDGVEGNDSLDGWEGDDSCATDATEMSVLNCEQ